MSEHTTPTAQWLALLEAAKTARTALQEHVSFSSDDHEEHALEQLDLAIQALETSQDVALGYVEHGIWTPLRWHPIETAPRDGTRVILASYVKPSKEAAKNGATAYWHVCDGCHFGSKGSNLWTGILGQPTFWMPRPQLPINESVK